MVRPLESAGDGAVAREYLVIAGPTGSGKSDLAMTLATRLGGEIVGCDSVQIYRGFDIGSAKPTADERARVPHHVVDCLDWNEDCDAALYARWARAAIDGIRARGKLPIVVGGTGLYLRALLGRGWHADLPKDDALRAALQRETTPDLYARLQTLDPGRAAELHPNDRFRVARALELVTLLGKPLRAVSFATDLAAQDAADPAAYVVVLEPERTALRERIAARTARMLAAGLETEVRALLAAGVPHDCKPMRSIGYAETVAVLRGTAPRDGLADAITVATRRYAKRQATWNHKVKADLRAATVDAAALADACHALFPRCPELRPPGL
jgi:tRNA dimethylallyltransferase